MKDLLLLASSSSAAEEAGESNGAIEKLIAVFKNPTLYIVVGCFIALILIIYLLRRFTHANQDSVVVIVRKGKIRKIINENDKVYYRVPFLDSIGAVMSLNEMSFTSDKLFINNGPDRLYKFNYTFVYKIINPELCYSHLNKLQETIEQRTNDSLRLLADNGNAQMLINDYRSSEKNILDVVNGAVNDLGIESISFKVNFIEPIGK